MPVYYNETNKHAAGWVRNLVADGLIPVGDVDDRDIRDVCAADLKGYIQCHFFAGVGLWPYALRLAGWPDDRPVWTGSCPCQPFSAAGSGAGFADERHLWPSWFWLIDQCRPDRILGEQVASKNGLMWLDLVSSDLEARGHTCGTLNFPSCGIGAPNIRQRTWWVADTNGRHARSEGLCGVGEQRWRENDHCFGDRQSGAGGSPQSRRLAYSSSDGCDEQQRGASEQSCPRIGWDQPSDRGVSGGTAPEGWTAVAGGMGDTSGQGLQDTEPQGAEGPWWRNERRATQQPSGPFHPWRELEWIACADGKRRPTQPGIFPLAPRYPGDVAKLRAYGNAINPLVAAEAIRAYIDIRGL